MDFLLKAQKNISEKTDTNGTPLKLPVMMTYTTTTKFATVKTLLNRVDSFTPMASSTVKRGEASGHFSES